MIQGVAGREVGHTMRLRNKCLIKGWKRKQENFKARAKEEAAKKK